VDHIDREIIRTLQRDGRITNQELANRVRLTPSPCLRRLNNLEAGGAIRGYTAQADPTTYGLSVTAFVRVSLREQNERTVTAFEAAIRRLDAVQDCYMLAGEGDYLLRVVAVDLRDYERFLRTELHLTPGIASISTNFCIGDVKTTPIFPALALPSGQ